MGWKINFGMPSEQSIGSQSAFAGYGLEEEVSSIVRTLSNGRNPLSLDMGWKIIKNGLTEKRLTVAIRFRWIWVGSKLSLQDNAPRWKCRNPLSLDMGWKQQSPFSRYRKWIVAIRFRWIWVGRRLAANVVEVCRCRNPLSLDMGWKKADK